MLGCYTNCAYRTYVFWYVCIQNLFRRKCQIFRKVASTFWKSLSNQPMIEFKCRFFSFFVPFSVNLLMLFATNHTLLSILLRHSDSNSGIFYDFFTNRPKKYINAKSSSRLLLFASVAFSMNSWRLQANYSTHPKFEKPPDP